MTLAPAEDTQVLQTPDDPAAWAVLADALLQRGDPRGELYALDAALARSPWGPTGRDLRARRRALIDQHGLVPDVPELVLDARWAHGWWKGLTLTWREPLRAMGEVLARVFGHPSARYVRRVTLNLGGHVRDLAPVVAALDTRDWPLLEALVIRSPPPHPRPSPISTDRMPRLATLALPSGDLGAEALQAAWTAGLTAARAAWRAGRLEDAHTGFEGLLHLVDAHGDERRALLAAESLGALANDLGRMDQAAELRDRVLRGRPGSADALLALGQTRRAQGRTHAALEHFE
ncbi:MAG: tetratricopeptide repeat protein, partial [Myxococcales bacterium]|nr:tetratricopeptide repeat protein [Myxococcales bacterium]